MPYRTTAEELDVHPGLWRAASAAFAIVATADGQIAASERARFESWLLQRSKSPARQREALTFCFELCGRLLAPAAAEALREAQALLRACETPAQRDLVLSAARAALVADERIDEREERALGQLCRLLELDPDRG